MITVLTGAPGHGKSYTSVKLIDEFVHEGKPVVTNVPLREDFAYQMARHHTLFGRWRENKVNERAAKIAELVHVCKDETLIVENEDGTTTEVEVTAMDQIMRVRFKGKGEGRAKVVIDEAHRNMNVRGATRGRTDEAKKRKMIVNYASGHRHYGVDLTLITQALGNLDVQVRNLLEFHSEVRNFRRLPVLGMIARLMPGGQLFLRITLWNDRAKTKAGVHLYTLSKRLASLYNTHSLEEGDMPEDVILLPSPPEQRLLPIVAQSSTNGQSVPLPPPAMV